jgi:hypothetical protein
VSAEDIQIDSAVQLALISTVKASLVSSESLRSSFNVTIDSVSGTNRRLTALRGLTREQHVLTSTAQIQYAVSFDVDKQKYLDAADGYSQMTTSYSAAIAGDQFNSFLHNYAPSGGSPATASGASTAIYSAFSVKIVQLMYPSFAPTASCRPTTMMPTRAPTAKTSKCITLSFII